MLTNFQERNQPQIHPDVEYRVHTKDLAKVKVNGDVILVSNKNGFIDYETSFFSVVLRSYEYSLTSLFRLEVFIIEDATLYVTDKRFQRFRPCQA